MDRRSLRKLAGRFVLLSLLLMAGPSTAQQICVATGDVDCSGDPTVGDISMIIDFFNITGTVPTCPEQMDINGDCVVDWDDFDILMECITIHGIPCPQTPTCCNPVLVPCCLGDANRSGGEPTIGDVSVLIDAKFISGTCNHLCLVAADINRSGGGSPNCDDITIGDISALIDCLFISGDIAPCYSCP